MFCDRCQRHFRTEMSLLQHLSASLRHNICDSCIPPVDFSTRNAFDDHCSLCHGLRRIADLRKLVFQDVYGYSGFPSDMVKPVFEIAVRLRSSKPEADTITDLSKSPLHVDVVKAIIKAALRLLPRRQQPRGASSKVRL